MSIKLYTDVHIPYAIVVGLRARSVDVVTAQEDGSARLSDPVLLDRATALDRALFTYDHDFLVEAARRQRAGETFAGIIYADQLNVTIGLCVSDLEVIAKVVNRKI
jgi:predicted nuclease of predicted toxin-antitoxin system